ncbi:H-2 class I histocompatibility antigen, Q10 alpha chain-like [Neoarius graeffei]|uniref:H-2 class I histocompatibility antigen, Q10 alpha chain-like n=1 Tax=Neoarius graeffei TaxID=443677 RepID=UPI00298C2545|nr:H-2 class I histocompatibility antigen, Q10 alpha chain-like [Neoarius graeffei]XP_060771444.1 H-2 class I histocompatibility antigen, Q10 alpha chain-like [Neoarius graeffei]
MRMKMAAVFVLVALGVLAPALGGEHSLFYTYTALSQTLDLPGIYDFIALGTLDDRELDYYNSKSQIKVPKQDWMAKKMAADYWDKGTLSRKSKEQWFTVNVDILIDRMRHNKSDLHVLQWRHGCVIDEGPDGSIKFLKGIDEYSYDGAEFLSFDEVNSRWIAPVAAAEVTKRKWDDVDILNQYTKGYLEKECVDWLTKFMVYGEEELRKRSAPVVHVFTKKALSDPDKLTLTCLVTGFYPKDVRVSLRKLKTSLPEHLVTSSGVRPNGDGTYQLRKSVEILKNEETMYDCSVDHITLKEPIISDNKGPRCLDCAGPKIQSGIIGGIVGVVVTLLVVGCVCVILKRMGKLSFLTRHRDEQVYVNGNGYHQAHTDDGAANGLQNGAANGIKC